MIEQQRIVKELALTRVGTGDYLSLQKLAARNASMVTSIGTKLRLTVQADVDGRSKKLAESGAEAESDDLIGGAAVKRGLRVVTG